MSTTRWSWLVAGLGFVLLALLFAPWFELDALPRHVYEFPDSGSGGFAGDPILGAVDVITGDLTGWGTGTFTSIVVVLLSVACVAQAVLGRSPALVAVVGAVVCGWIVVRIVSPPDDLLAPAWGIWASLAVVVAILVAALLGVRAARAAAPAATPAG